jgi:hypothetical protein
VLSEIEEAAKLDADDEGDPDAWDWDAAAALFLHRLAEFDWNADIAESLVVALLPRLGYRREPVRGRGEAWFKRR